ncbi:FixH family protein [Campylobacter sp. VTCC 70190]|uniref:FixH family protein n=1 Tax=Campylobacter sp. VTCC 70190 TaxID=3392118 RepID=UPI00398E465F
MSQNKKSFWPYGILLSIFAIVLACVATIIFASQYPVHEDDFYFDSYQNVETNYNEIQKQQANFDKFFKITFQNDKVTLLGKRKISSYEVEQNSYIANFKISSLQNLNPDDLKIQVLLTRPFTRDFDQRLDGQIQNGILSIALPKLDKGRWELKLKFYANQETVGFFSYELNAQ